MATDDTTAARSAVPTTTTTNIARTDPVAAEIERLVRGEHGDPHHVLGGHVTSDGVVIRAYRPDAVAVEILLPDGEVVPMRRIHDAGVHAGVVEGEKVPDYRLRVHYGDGRTFEVEDPYRFWPTIGELDLHLIGEGRHEQMWCTLGAHVREHQGVQGTSFAVWAPNARSVRVVGDMNGWDGRLNPMRSLGSSGIWELFLPDARAGQRYKYEILGAHGELLLKADPFAFATEIPPDTASVIWQSTYSWDDDEWLARRASADHVHEPMSVYEVHVGSWRWTADGEGGWRPLTYRELADELADYVVDLGFTHVEFLPVAEHPFGPSWGYQVSAYFAPTSRFGTPDDFRYLVDRLHERGIGVIVDWVPAHFPKDQFALAKFDGTALYEHADPRQGEHPDWGTLVFNFGRNEVRNFLTANALYWLKEMHVDGLRVDAVASMLYLDYSRKEGEWVPNVHGGRENLEAISFLKEMNEVVYREVPGAMTIAEESTAFPGVSRPTYLGGLGFGFKWNMGWMHDTLEFFSKDPIHRRFHHHQLTFGLLYAFSENFVLPLSHDEVVHGKGSLLNKMPGDRWQQMANLRALYGWMWAHPGKQLLFMGSEIAQEREWSESRSLDWHLLEWDQHQGVQSLVRAMNEVYRSEPALFERDFTPDGFRWIDANDADNSVLSFARSSASGDRVLVCVANLTPVPRHGYRTGLPRGGRWVEVLNTDRPEFAGSGVGNPDFDAETTPWHGLDWSAELDLPPLGVVWLRPA